VTSQSRKFPSRILASITPRTLDSDREATMPEPAEKRVDPVVREVPCKTLLNRSSISDYSLNCQLEDERHDWRRW